MRTGRKAQYHISQAEASVAEVTLEICKWKTKVKSTGDLHLAQPVVKQIHFQAFKLVNSQAHAIR